MIHKNDVKRTPIFVIKKPKSKSIFHITDRPWPIDRKFFGQVFDIGYLSKYSIHRSYVRSSFQHDPLESDLEIRAAKALFSVDYSHGKKIFKIMRDEIRGHINEGELPFIVYHTQKGIDSINGFRRKVSKDVKGIFHLHCRPDVYGFVYEDRITKRGELFKELEFDAYIAVTQKVKEDYIKYNLVPPEKVHVISNGVSLDVYKPISDEEKEMYRLKLGMNRLNTIIGYSGRVTKDKGKDLILNIMEQLENESDVGFLIAASGERERNSFVKEVIEKVPRIYTEGRIKFVIDISKYTAGINADIKLMKEIEEYLSDAIDFPDDIFGGFITKPIQSLVDVMMLTSYSEAFSLVTLESLAAGTPIVVLDSGGPTELVSSLGGVIVEKGNNTLETARSFVDAIMEINDEVRRNKKIREEYIVAVRRSGRTARDMARMFDNLIESI